MKEFKRQVFHFVSGLALAFLFLAGWVDWEITALLTLVVVGAGFYMKRHQSLLQRVVAHFEREKHLINLPLKGSIYYLIGATLTMLIFQPLPAFGGLVTLAIADSVGTLYGKHLGVAKIRWNPDKHMEGPILGGLLAAITCMVVLPFAPAVLGAYAGAFVDTLKLRFFGFEVDDNLLIPLISALVITLSLNYGGF